MHEYVCSGPVALYTHYMYRAIGDLGARRPMNGFPRYSEAHRMLILTGATDASSEAWGGPVREPGSPDFSMMSDFPEE